MGFIINKRTFSLACLYIISAWAVTCVPLVMEHGAYTDASTSLVMHQKDSFSNSLHGYFWLGHSLCFIVPHYSYHCLV